MSSLNQVLDHLEAAKRRNELDAMRRIATKAHQDKRRFCRTMQNEKQPCWGELRPYDRLYTLLETITLEEYDAIMARAKAAEEAERADLPPRPEPDNDKLYQLAVLELKKKRRAKPYTKP